MFVRAYLRASTDDQDANRAKGALDDFAKARDLTIASYYVENQSGAKLDRPELMRLLNESQPGDLLLTEQVDRLSRLRGADWEKLKGIMQERRVKVVALDLPTSWNMAKANADDFNEKVFSAINAMMLDMLAAISRKDYEDRRRRQSEGIALHKANFKGKGENKKRNAGIIAMLKKKQSWNSIIAATECSRSTLSKLAKRVKAESASAQA
jgi:DNA invertase Pin-like site-specific DNA recombinase